MNTVLFIVLRRMRVPLLLLSTVYAVATLGLTLIPGVDDEGNTWHMDFFHAFYFVSFMGTTTGFGEIPYAFSHAQRMWALVFIYITVVTWIYALGSLITLIGNETLRKAVIDFRFSRQVRMIQEPFYLVCGYGDTGSKLVSTLRNRRMQASVIDIDQARIDALMLEDDPMFVPGLKADARDPDNLIMAGMTHPMCECVVALTNDNAANLHIAISATVLNPDVKVIGRADAHDIEANMASFGTDVIIDPFDTFARNIALATYAPHQFLLLEWLSKARDEPLSDVTVMPRGLWIICGFGRFGKAIYREMEEHGIPTIIIEPDDSISDLPEGSIIGYGTEASTLNEANVDMAVGIIAGADDDSNNLSIIVTAKQLNPDLFVIVRETLRANRPLFESIPANIVMQIGETLANKIRTLLTNPLIDEFLSLARAHDDDWAKALTDRLRQISPEVLPHTWAATVGEEETAAVASAIERGETVRIRDLVRDHTDRDRELPLMVLFHSNRQGAFCLPEGNTGLDIGDQLLFAGTRASQSKALWNLNNEAALTYILNGIPRQQTVVGQWLASRITAHR